MEGGSKSRYFSCAVFFACIEVEGDILVGAERYKTLVVSLAWGRPPLLFVCDMEAVVLDVSWPCEGVVRSVASERALAPIVLRPGEFGRGRDLPRRRLDEIELACAEHGMHIHQALSLRRQLIRAKPGGMRRVNMSSAMGTQQGQAQAAKLFEDAVTTYLRSVGAQFHTEQELRALRGRSPRGGPTPDVVFTAPTRVNGVRVNWLDCKLFYGSAMLSGNGKLPVGKLKSRARRYTHDAALGVGGFVFGQSFCADLDVPECLLLDATPLNLSELQAFQNTQNT